MTSTSSRAAVAHLPPPAHGLRLRMSYEEYLAWAPESMFAEWADGEVAVAMPATDLHQRVVDLLLLLLGTFVTLRGLGEVRTGPEEVKLWPEGGPAREPDLFFARAAHLQRLEHERFSGGPNLVVEVISDDSVGRDRNIKRGEYARAGVEEYWIIDPRLGVQLRPWVRVYRLDARGRYGDAELVRQGAVRSTVAPGFWIRAEWLWTTPMPRPLDLLTEMLRYPEGPDGPEAPGGLDILPWAGHFLERGRLEGEARGRTEGRAEGARAALRTIVLTRFGTLPVSLDGRIAAADLATLEALTTQALQAPSLATLLEIARA